MEWSDLPAREQLYRILKYEQDPVFFVEDDYGLSIKLWPKQKYIIDTFYRYNKQFLVLVAGMGASKTTILAVMACIELKSLLVKDWTKILGIFPHSPLFVTLASISEKQAMDAVWNQISPLIKNSPFFRYYGCDVQSDLIKFSKRPNVFLRLVSASSDTAVGRRSKFVGIDEMAKFEQTAGPRGGWQVFNSLVGSTKTFKEHGHVAVVGSPKHPTDILMTLYRQALEQRYTMLGVKLATWELNPNFKKEDFGTQFTIDPLAALRDYAADPQQTSDLYFPNQEIFVYSDKNVLEELRDGLKVDHPPYDYVLAGDPAYRHDAFGLALGHQEGDTIVIDGALGIKPSETPEVNPMEISRFIDKISDEFMIRKATFDTWYFTETIDRLRAKGIIVENHAVTKADYDNFKRLVYQGKVILPPSRQLELEIKTLITTGNKVDHPRKGSKDVIDAVVNCTRCLSEQRKVYAPVEVGVF